MNVCAIMNNAALTDASFKIWQYYLYAMCNLMNDDGYTSCTKSRIDSYLTCMSQFSMLSENCNWFEPEGSSATSSVLYSASVGLESSTALHFGLGKIVIVSVAQANKAVF